jgi:hypothetical protein
MRLDIILGIIPFILGISIQLYLRFTNIDMSEMRLLIEYWDLHLISIAFYLLGYKFLTYKEKRNENIRKFK